MSVIRAEDYNWYEVKAVRKDGRKDFICRLIATDRKSAISKLQQDNVKLAGSKILGRIVFNRYVRTLEACLVDKKLLSFVNLNNESDVEMLRKVENITGEKKGEW